MRSLREIQLQKLRLVELCRRQRQELAYAAAPLAPPIAGLDSAFRAMGRAFRSPLFWAASAALAVALRPRRLLPMMRRGIVLWQGALVARRAARSLLRAARME